MDEPADREESKAKSQSRFDSSITISSFNRPQD